MEKRNCLQCGKEFLAKNSPSRVGRGIFCSRLCKTNHFKGKHLSPESEFKKGMSPWNKGIEVFSKIHKGNNVGIRNLHTWVERRLGKPNKCQKCGSTTAKRFEWSNISRQYKRDLNDWQRLCIKCHQRYDGHSIKNNKERLKNGESSNRSIWSEGM